jgi:hypothetical protein
MMSCVGALLLLLVVAAVAAHFPSYTDEVSADVAIHDQHPITYASAHPALGANAGKEPTTGDYPSSQLQLSSWSAKHAAAVVTRGEGAESEDRDSFTETSFIEKPGAPTRADTETLGAQGEHYSIRVETAELDSAKNCDLTKGSADRHVVQPCDFPTSALPVFLGLYAVNILAIVLSLRRGNAGVVKTSQLICENPNIAVNILGGYRWWHTTCGSRIHISLSTADNHPTT